MEMNKAYVLIALVLIVGAVAVTAMNSFTSSVQVPWKSADELDLSEEEEEIVEKAESEALAPLAKLSPAEATQIALDAVDKNEVGEITDVELENEYGNVVYAVEFTKNGIETDVKIDPTTGEILLIESDLTETDQD